MDFLETVEEQLVAATERGVGRRRWRRPWLVRTRLPWRASTVGIAAGVVTALAASAIAATLTLPAARHKAHVAGAGTPHAVSFATAGAVPAGFQPISFTATGELTWWLLGQAPCGKHKCTAIVRTTDGGPSFTRIPAPPTANVSQVRFANARDGYAFAPQLWTTHNGGRTWTEPQLGANELAVADGYAFAVEGSPAALMRSPVGRDKWKPVAGIGLHGEGVGDLWVQGGAVIVQDGNRLLVSNDHGAHFTHVRGVVGAGDCSYDAAIDPSVIWGVCMTGMAPDLIVRSTDSGNTFGSAAQVPDGPIDAFAAATPSVAVASGQGPLFRTTNGGVSWSRVSAPAAGWTYLGFTDASHGVALGNFGSGGRQDSRLYYTTDGGASYHLVPIR
jgi:hypothetical protein